MRYCIVKNCDYSEKIAVVEKNCVLILILQICPGPFLGNKCYSSTCLINRSNKHTWNTYHGRTCLVCRGVMMWSQHLCGIGCNSKVKVQSHRSACLTWTSGQRRASRQAVSHSAPSCSLSSWDKVAGAWRQLLVPGAKVKNVWSYTTTTPYTVTAWCFLQDRNRLIVQELFHVSELFKWWSSFGFYTGCGHGLFWCLWGTCCHNLQGDLI